MVGHVLGIEQPEAARTQPRDQVHQRDLGGIAHAMEHALAKERAPERDAVESSDQLIALISLEAVTMAALVEFSVEHADAGVDPGARAAGLRVGAAGHHGLKI